MTRCGRSSCSCCQRVRRHGRTLAGTPVALAGAGESIGRWGPLTTYGGRTEGKPCTFLLDACSDHDVDAWLAEAKKWLSLAAKMRETNIVHAWGTDWKKWPAAARFGELGYKAARDLIAGDTGWTDAAKVASFIEAQKYAKLALEGYVVALEKELNVTVEVSPDFSDPIIDPQQRPPVYTPPKFPSLGSIIGVPLIIGGLAVVLVLASGGGRRGATA